MTTLLLLVAAALASPGYPAAIASDQGMPCVPQCTLCHATTAGGGPVVTDVGQALVDRGLTGGSNTDLLQTALTALETDGVDSDGDGIPDVDELTNGDDPNGGNAFCGDTAPATPTYGCFNTSAGLPWGLGGVALAGLAMRRRR